MAWIAAIVLVGLALVVFDVARERIHARRSRRRAERGLPPVVWSRRRRLTTFAAGVGAVGVVLAVLFVLRGGSSSSSKTNSLNTIPKSSSSSSTSSTSSSTTAPDPGRPPQQVRVVVVNASGVPRAAQQKSDALKVFGYQMVRVGNETVRTGSAVQCRAGFEKEAATLAHNVGGGAGVEPFPNPAPLVTANSDCVVVLGK